MVFEFVNTYSTSFAMVSALFYWNALAVSYITLFTRLIRIEILLHSNPRIDQRTSQPTNIQVNYDYQVHIKI